MHLCFQHDHLDIRAGKAWKRQRGERNSGYVHRQVQDDEAFLAMAAFWHQRCIDVFAWSGELHHASPKLTD
jgi:hypothetical protein